MVATSTASKLNLIVTNRVLRKVSISSTDKALYILEMENGTIKFDCTKNFSERAKQISTSSGLKIINWCHSEYVEKNVAIQI